MQFAVDCGQLVSRENEDGKACMKAWPKWKKVELQILVCGETCKYREQIELSIYSYRIDLTGCASLVELASGPDYSIPAYLCSLLADEMKTK